MPAAPDSMPNAIHALRAQDAAAPRSPGRLARLRRRIRRLLRPPRILRPTRAGWCFFAITFCVGFAALNTGNNLLYLVLSLMLAFLVLSGVLSESALRGISVRRHLPDELFADGEASVGLEIHNAQERVPAFAIVVEDCLEHGDERPLEKAECLGRTVALRVGPGEHEHRRYALRPTARGPLRFAGVRVATRYPFGLFSKLRTIELADEALVYPGLDDAAARPPRSRASDEGEFGAARLREGAEVRQPARLRAR